MTGQSFRTPRLKKLIDAPPDLSLLILHAIRQRESLGRFLRLHSLAQEMRDFEVNCVVAQSPAGQLDRLLRWLPGRPGKGRPFVRAYQVSTTGLSRSRISALSECAREFSGAPGR